MSSRLSILTSILFCAAAALPAVTAMARPFGTPDHFARYHGLHGARFAEPVARARNSAGKATAHKPVLFDPSFRIVDEPDTDPTLYGTRVFGTNESGQLSGTYMDSSGAFHAFLATPDGDSFTFAPITVHHNDTFGFLMNNKGEAFGTYDDRHTGLENSWLRLPNGKIEIVALPEGTNGTIVQDVNDKGVMVGNYFDDSGAFRGFIRAKDGTITRFDDPMGGTGDGLGTNPIGINDLGDISGIVFDSGNVAHGFIRHHEDGSFEHYDVAGAGTGDGQGTFGLEIDNNGGVTGYYVDSNDVTHGFIRDPDGNVTAVNAPDAGTGPFQGTVVEHREAGWSIGEYIDSNDVSHGYLRKANGKYVEFDPQGVGPGGTFTVLSSNRAHQIVGTYKDENGIRHGFIRNP